MNRNKLFLSALVILLAAGVLKINAEGSGSMPAKVDLVIISTKMTAKEILAEKKLLKNQFSDARIISSNDCTNLKPSLIFLVAGIYNTSEAAEKGLSTVRQSIKDAYHRPCNIKYEGLLYFDIPIIHPSIEKVPDDAVNWDDSDMMTELFSFSGLGHFISERNYVSNDTEMTEGRRQTIYFFDRSNNKKTQLQEHCWNFSDVKHNSRFFTFHCATEMAANNFIHSSFVYDREKLSLVHT
ncbi:MAG: hypothetical protein OEY07_01270, partial [Gammaproteobacteria bacterium]|nr:hypothetical protein [Gammaproteobacteria bacterium]